VLRLPVATRRSPAVARGRIAIGLESQLIGLALILLGTIRAWDDVDTSNALAYVFVAGITALFVSLLALEWYMLGHTRSHPRRSRVVSN
jgi:hypothetical protein